MTIARKLFAALLALLIAAPVFAQAQRTYTQPELDQMLAPIALYPDPLLSQVLMAATYPDEVAEAARWSRANPGLQGDDAVRAVQNEGWDPSVQSLVAFPQVLARMAENPDWTRRLGDAFLAQEPHIMDTVQQLRRRAEATGNLQSSEQVDVQHQGQIIVVQPASPQFIYVPYYDPFVVYGPWWWPAYRPVYWSPWPRPYAIRVSLGFFFGNFDWHRRYVHVAHPSAYYYRPRYAVNRTAPHRWQHEPRRREAVVERRTAQPTRQIQAQPRYQQPQQQTNVAAPAPVKPAAQAQPQVRVQARADRREERERPRIERREIRQAQPQVHPQAQPQPRARVPEAVAPQQPRARMPEAVAPQQPRAERHEQRREQRQERREMRQDLRHEREPKGRDRS